MQEINITNNFEFTGTQCMEEDCRVFDYLPFKCYPCGMEFCKEHYDQHKCNKNKNITLHQCPVCLKLVKVDSDSNIDEIVSIHIDNGCNKFNTYCPPDPNLFSSATKYRCYFNGCKNKEYKKELCEHCSLNFCKIHVLPICHKCPSAKKVNEPKNEYIPTLLDTTTATLSQLPDKISQVYTKIIDSSSKLLHSRDQENEKIYLENKKQNNDIMKLREEQKCIYHDKEEFEIKIIQMNGNPIQGKFKKTDTINNIILFINQTTTYNLVPYTLCRDSNGNEPFQKTVPELNLQQLNLNSSSTLYMFGIEKLNIKSNQCNDNKNQNNNSTEDERIKKILENNNNNNTNNNNNSNYNPSIKNGVLNRNYSKQNNINIDNIEKEILTFFNPVIKFFENI